MYKNNKFPFGWSNFFFFNAVVKMANQSPACPQTIFPHTAGPHLAGTSQVRTWRPKSENQPPNGAHLSRSQAERKDSTEENRTAREGTYFVSRWEVLQSLLRVPKFICIHLSWQSKTWPLITAWLLWKGGRMRHRPLFYAFDKPETKFQMIKLMLICLS